MNHASAFNSTQIFTRVAIANRGEIACRVIQTLRKMGISSILLCAPADRDSRAALMADAVALLPSNDLSESYLSIESLISAALSFQAQAIHPGYGFLSENAEFAQAVQDAGLTWIGPSPKSISLMGDKKAAKTFAQEAGVPGVPGMLLDDALDANTLTKATLDQIESIGLPVLIKAAFGGGGRGMRKVMSLSDLPDQIQQASSEAKNAFGNGTVFIEKCIEHGRHIEVQVLSDQHGNHIALGERDCSIQRRHQKVVEECPATCLQDDTRAKLHNAATTLAKACDYQGAGTVEFMVADSGEFYFLEMNTRLQVEHPVTEAVFGVDLVAWQIRIAQGEALSKALQEKKPEGHSIEVRWYAEDPNQDFMPQSGELLCVIGYETTNLDIRWDHQLCPPQTITPYYDPLLAKIIATGPDRATALKRLQAKLSQVHCFGLSTNLSFLQEVLKHPEVVQNKFHTQWLEQNLDSLKRPCLETSEQICLGAAISFFVSHTPTISTDMGAHTTQLTALSIIPSDNAQVPNSFSPSWVGQFGCYAFILRGKTYVARVQKQKPETTQANSTSNATPNMHLTVSLEHTHQAQKTSSPAEAPKTLTLHLQCYNAHTLIIHHQPTQAAEPGITNQDAPLEHPPRQMITFQKTQSALYFNDQHHHYTLPYGDFAQASAEGATSDELRAPCQALVKALLVSPGDTVTAGQALLAIEAMKIEQTLCSPRDGLVETVFVDVGKAVADGQVLLKLKQKSPSDAQDGDNGEGGKNQDVLASAS